MIAACQISFRDDFHALNPHVFYVAVEVNNCWAGIVEFFLLEQLHSVTQLKNPLVFECFAVRIKLKRFVIN